MHPEIRNTLGWLIFAWFLMGTAIWQAQVTVVREAAARQRTLPPPVRARHADRSTAFTGDVEADYRARCAKGITDREIGWIVEDFQNAGLAEPPPMDAPPVEFLNYRAAQQRWYHALLVDALRLSPEQSARAAAKLRELFATAKADYERGEPPGEGTAEDPESIRTRQQRLTTGTLWLMEEALMPWNLCQLTPAQEKLTWKDWILREREKSHLPRPTTPEFDPTNSVEEKMMRVLDADPLMAHMFQLGNLPILVTPGEAVFVDAILPLPRPLKFPDRAAAEFEISPGDYHRFHPAQFKLALLFSPERARELREAINGETVEDYSEVVPQGFQPKRE